MKWLIVWAPMLEFLIGGFAVFFLAEKFKEVAAIMIFQIILYMILMNALLIYGFWLKH
ncbi:hypothetical protein EDD69_12228 [Thermolongibacillus altinsuensis]|jgi:hypothetical protein|uniref:Uncharacterized protein n=1 Tax=Thermolongibacillus altinsuensis TaxID=575256 RepID=A0A4R1QCW8_9BACL|nr:hypothetical protein [Thermolongibacillus altinsuensis]TCL44915.1 hypothetical protein EDD69_12228 [Thermolongibacillus altinsuensis]GMB08193.1 hypothetical protein B1no1_09030 [Thermolongibacillus altinsuensis]